MFDIINGCFELFGCLFILPSILNVYREKKVAGVSCIHAIFFWVWGIWNMAYYPHLGQWWSTAGGVGVFLANTVWLIGLLKYRKR